MSTPENSKTGPISKSLLTPCRRPGLSRKIKTPLLPASPACQYAPLDIVTTPKPINNSYTIVAAPILKEQNATITTPQSIKQIPKPQSASKESEHKVKITNDKSTKNKKNSQNELKNTHKFEENCANKSNKSEGKSKTQQAKPQLVIDSGKTEVSKTVKNILPQQQSQTCSTESKEHIYKSKNMDKEKSKLESKDVKVNNDEKETKFKNSLKRLSMKRSISNNSQVSDLDDISTQETILSESNSLNETPLKAKKPRLDLCEEVNLDTILEIQRRIKVKQGRLDELKRAATYKKIHNLEDLEKLIDVWKTGCRKALNNLLQKLQTHGTITMERLIDKFNVPEDVINTNSTDLSQ